MPRRKEPWSGVVGWSEPRQNGTVWFQARLENEPDRLIELQSISSIDEIVRAYRKADNHAKRNSHNGRRPPARARVRRRTYGLSTREADSGSPR